MSSRALHYSAHALITSPAPRDRHAMPLFQMYSRELLCTQGRAAPRSRIRSRQNYTSTPSSRACLCPPEGLYNFLVVAVYPALRMHSLWKPPPPPPLLSSPDRPLATHDSQGDTSLPPFPVPRLFAGRAPPTLLLPRPARPSRPLGSSVSHHLPPSRYSFGCHRSVSRAGGLRAACVRRRDSIKRHGSPAIGDPSHSICHPCRAMPLRAMRCQPEILIY